MCKDMPENVVSFNTEEKECCGGCHTEVPSLEEVSNEIELGEQEFPELTPEQYAEMEERFASQQAGQQFNQFIQDSYNNHFLSVMMDILVEAGLTTADNVKERIVDYIANDVTKIEENVTKSVEELKGMDNVGQEHKLQLKVAEKLIDIIHAWREDNKKVLNKEEK